MAVGGELDEIQGGRKNVGSEALSAFMFQQASQPDPVDLLGAMFVIEGLGNRLALGWAARLQEQLALARRPGELPQATTAKPTTSTSASWIICCAGWSPPNSHERVVRTAEVVARLYALQLEEVTLMIVDADPGRPDRAGRTATRCGWSCDDQRRWTRRWLYPLARSFSRVAVWPDPGASRRWCRAFAAHPTMDRLCVWFLQRFVSPTAGALLIRHFLVETNLLNFLVRNTAMPGAARGDAAPDHAGAARRPGRHRARPQRVRRAHRLGREPLARAAEPLDFSMLEVEPIDAVARCGAG